jgi:Family of unknown function (DUF5647)
VIDRATFADKQLELAAEFAQYVVDHPEVDEVLPPRSSIWFEVVGEPEFSQYSRMLAERQHREEGVPVVLVRTKGLLPPQGSRLIDPVIEPLPAVA